jgi:hypothetical protein
MGNHYSGYMRFVKYPKIPIFEPETKPRKYGRKRKNKVSESHKLQIVEPVVQFISIPYAEYNHGNANPHYLNVSYVRYFETENNKNHLIYIYDGNYLNP